MIIIYVPNWFNSISNERVKSRIDSSLVDTDSSAVVVQFISCAWLFVLWWSPECVKPVHLHVTKTGQVQQIKITGARHAPLSPHVTEIVSVSACWRLDVIEIIFFRNRKYFFSPFLSGACILSPCVGTSPPFCTWIQIVIAPGPGHVMTMCHLCVERLVLWLLGHELVPPVAQCGVALVSVLQSPLEIVTLTGTGL